MDRERAVESDGLLPLPTRFRTEFMVGGEMCLSSNDVRFGSSGHSDKSARCPLP